MNDDTSRESNVRIPNNNKPFKRNKKLKTLELVPKIYIEIVKEMQEIHKNSAERVCDFILSLLCNMTVSQCAKRLGCCH